MTNLEIARVFNEEKSFKEFVLNYLTKSDDWVSFAYCIFAEDHEPLTEEQKRVWDEHNTGGIIELWVDIDWNELLGG